MNEELCKEKHKNISEELKGHTEELKLHEEEIMKLKLEGLGHSKDINNLCGKIDDLVVTINSITETINENMKEVTKTINDVISGVTKWFFITISTAVVSGGIGLAYYFIKKGLEG